MNITYLKGTVPVKSGKDVYDALIVLASSKEMLELEEPLDVISPFVMSYEEQTLLYQAGRPLTRRSGS